jgi:hypothetical protein
MELSGALVGMAIRSLADKPFVYKEQPAASRKWWPADLRLSGIRIAFPLWPALASVTRERHRHEISAAPYGSSLGFAAHLGLGIIPDNDSHTADGPSLAIQRHQLPARSHSFLVELEVWGLDRLAS